MATADQPTNLDGLDDPQRVAAFVVGLLLVVVGVAGLTGVVDADVGLGPGLVFGLFGVPLWLGVTAVVAGLLGILLSFYGGAGTTFNKVATGLVLPAVIALAVVDWGLAVGSILTMALGVLALLVAVALVVVGGILLFKRPLALVLPIVALLAIADWAVGLSTMAPASEAVNLPTIGLLVALAVVVGVVAFEGGRRTTRFE